MTNLSFAILCFCLYANETCCASQQAVVGLILCLEQFNICITAARLAVVLQASAVIVIPVCCRGRIEQEGTPKEILEKPATPFVMNFIADVNQIPSTCQVGCTSPLSNSIHQAATC